MHAELQHHTGRDMSFESLIDKVRQAETALEASERQAGANWRQFKVSWKQAWTPGRIVSIGLVSGFLVGKAEPAKGKKPRPARAKTLLLGITKAYTTRVGSGPFPTELEDAIDRQVKFYSSGMQMRLGFSVAAFLDPAIMLVDEVLADARAHYGPKVFPLNVPINPGPNFNQVLDVLRNEIVTYETGGSGKFKEEPATGEWEDSVTQLHRELIELIAESDDTLLNKFFEQGSLSEEEFRAGIHAAVQAQMFIPLFCTSAASNVGVGRLLDFIAKYGSSPLDREKVDAEDARSGAQRWVHHAGGKISGGAGGGLRRSRAPPRRCRGGGPRWCSSRPARESSSRRAWASRARSGRIRPSASCSWGLRRPSARTRP